MDKDSLESILLDYLKRAVSDLKVDFGSLVILDKERKIISMARIGEFRFDGKFSEHIKDLSFFNSSDKALCLFISPSKIEIFFSQLSILP
jgi:hypothetical protein